MSLESCAKLCLDCYQTCTAVLANHCLPRGGDHVTQAHVTCMQDCAEICHTSADFLLRRSPSHQTTCRACAEICERCAESCAQIDDMNMHRCADVCRACAELCHRMSSGQSMHAHN